MSRSCRFIVTNIHTYIHKFVYIYPNISSSVITLIFSYCLAWFLVKFFCAALLGGLTTPILEKPPCSVVNFHFFFIPFTLKVAYSRCCCIKYLLFFDLSHTNFCIIFDCSHNFTIGILLLPYY